jgi:predicted amidohydrolase YtcJ
MFRSVIYVTALAVCALSAFAQTAELVVTNAQILTLNPKQPKASSLAVRGGLILAVGDDLSRYIDASTRVIDAEDHVIMPGLIDSHGHVRALGAALDEVDLRGLPSPAAVADRVRAAVRQKQTGIWVIGRSWDQNLWPAKAFPTAADLDPAGQTNPIALSRVDGHALWVNRRALDLAGIKAATPDPPGGKIVRDSAGAPTGVFLDTAQELIRRRIPPLSREQIELDLLRATQELAHYGITTVHDAGVDAADIAAYRDLITEGMLPIHIYAMLQGSDAKLLDAWLAKGPEISDNLTIRAIKLFADGALGSRGAALIEPYTDDPGNRGLLISDRAAIRAVAERAAAKGFQVATHAIGDRAVRTTLDAYGDVLKGANDKRFRIEHSQVVALEDFPRFAQYSLIASMQPTHATSDMAWAPQRLGPERILGAYAWKSFLRLGVHVAAGSDFPVESPNPMYGIYAAVTRETKDGIPPNGWYPDQRMTRMEALRAFTVEGAYAAFEENSKGTLEPGKTADFILISGDPLTMPSAALWKIRIMMTVAGGHIVFSTR